MSIFEFIPLPFIHQGFLNGLPHQTKKDV